MDAIAKFYQKLKTNKFEEEKLLAIIRKILPDESTILDVGCGYGRYLTPLSISYHVLGVEANSEIISYMTNKKYKVISPQNFQQKNKKKFDLILMSHFIEHFSSDDLIEILNTYLKFLKPNGFLVIATPTMNKYFWEDATHVRPYDTASIMQITKSKAQVRYHTKNNLILEELHFFRTPILFKYEALMFKVNGNKCAYYFCSAFNILSKVVFNLSGSYLGLRQSWIGVFKKV